MSDDVQTTLEPQDETRKQIAQFLPDALAKALKSYHEFMEGNDAPKESAEKFAKHHTACKAAIAHIELLIKLAKWAHLPDAKADDHNRQIVLSALLQEAGDEIKQTKSKTKVKRDGEWVTP